MAAHLAGLELELLTMAFVCNLTRAATFMWSIETGRFLQFEDGTIHNRVLVTILQALGHEIDSFGELDSGSGPLPGF